MPLSGLEKSTLKLILFGGKGGVGKTTCASSAGLFLARDFKALLISTDPAHSLSDSLGLKLGDEIKEVNGTRNLSALEINAEKALSEFKAKHGDQIRRILNTSTYMDEDDIDSVFDLPIPGMDEVMGFKSIMDLIEETEFDKYVVDTAPTGHALRLLTLPSLLDGWIKAVAKLRWKYRHIVESFAGEYKEDEGDDFLVEMKKIVKKMESLLKDGNRCEFIAVTIPEDMAIAETERLVNNLRHYGVKVGQLVINNVVSSMECEFCRERRKEQEKYIKQITKKFARLSITTVPLQPREVKGIDTLNSFKDLLFNHQ